MKNWHVRLLLLLYDLRGYYGTALAFTQTPRRGGAGVAVQTPGHMYMFCAAPRLRCVPPL